MNHETYLILKIPALLEKSIDKLILYLANKQKK